MAPSLRKLLAESHVGAIATAVLNLWAFYFALGALGYLIATSADPIVEVTEYLATAVAIRGIPAASPGNGLLDTFALQLIVGYLFNAVSYFVAAWLLARWVYATGPFRAMKTQLVIFRRQHV